jgi:hypothetical protein
MSYKLLFAIATAVDLELEQMDVKTAFLSMETSTRKYTSSSPRNSMTAYAASIASIRHYMA